MNNDQVVSRTPNRRIAMLIDADNMSHTNAHLCASRLLFADRRPVAFASINEIELALRRSTK